MKDDPNRSDFLIETAEEASALPKSARRRWVIAGVILAHVVLFVVFAFWYLPSTNRNPVGQTTQQAGATDGVSAGGSAGVAPTAAELVPDDVLSKTVDMEIERSARLPDDQKLSELEKNLQRLESVADAESVEDITNKLTSTLGLDSDAYQPKPENTEGEFNYDTAQLDDVTRDSNGRGGWVYQATMVDADGRKSTVTISATEGEAMYTAFQKMKQYPMAAGIYRSIVMPMIQKLFEAQQLAEQAASEAQRIQQETESSSSVPALPGDAP